MDVVYLSNQNVVSLETLRRLEAQRWRVNISSAAASLSINKLAKEVFSDISKYESSTLKEAPLKLQKEVTNDGNPTR
jgi:hypothetical protein